MRETHMTGIIGYFEIIIKSKLIFYHETQFKTSYCGMFVP